MKSREKKGSILQTRSYSETKMRKRKNWREMVEENWKKGAERIIRKRA